MRKGTTVTKPMVLTQIRTLECPVCRNAEAFLSHQLTCVELFYCHNCEHRFTDPKSIVKKEEYNEKYYEEKHSQWFNHPDYFLFNWIYEKVKTLPAGSSVLDVGCGNGAFLRYLRSKNSTLKLYGIDYRNNKSEDGIIFFQGDIFEQRFDKTFDVVINLAVIEHVFEVNNFVNRLNNFLNPNGLLVTMTVNEQGLIYKISRLCMLINLNFIMNRLYDQHHVNHFGKKSLKKLVENSGLVVKDHLFHVPPLKAVDTPADPDSFLGKFYIFVLFVLFHLEQLCSATLLQTIVAKKNMSNT